MQWSRIDVYWTSLSMHENNSIAFIHSTSVMRFASLISVWNSHRIDICCIGSWNSLHAYRMVFLLIYFMIVKVMIRCQRGIFVKRYLCDFPILCVNFTPVAELATLHPTLSPYRCWFQCLKFWYKWYHEVTNGFIYQSWDILGRFRQALRASVMHWSRMPDRMRHAQTIGK